MKEAQRISNLFEALYNGEPWIDVNILSTIKHLPAKQAAKKNPPLKNSIWAIVNHIIDWRLNVLKRIQSQTIKTPDHNYFVDIKDTTEKAWQTTLKALEDSQQNWLAFLKNYNSNDFEKIYTNNNLSYYEHIHGILQHDAYHLGQVVLLIQLSK
jgi:uncharacterized damage-inducible protein DinB